MPCLYCRKMCCLNGSRKLHFVQKIRLDRIIKYMGPEGFFAHLRNFLQVLDLLIFLQKQPGHWAEVVCIFTLLLYPYFVCQMAMETSAGKSKKYLLSPIFMDKNLMIGQHKPEGLSRSQAGVQPPLYRHQSIQVLKARKIFRPFGATS